MQEKLDGLWQGMFEERVDGKVSAYLRMHHPQYQKLWKQMRETESRHPIRKEFFDGGGQMALGQEDHQILKEYLRGRDELECLEREYAFFFGQCTVLFYKEMLDWLKKDMG